MMWTPPSKLADTSMTSAGVALAGGSTPKVALSSSSQFGRGDVADHAEHQPVARQRSRNA